MYVDHSGGTERTDTQNCPCNTLLYGFRLRLTCPVGHNGLLFILGESTRPRGFYPRFTFLAATALPDPYSDCYSRIYRRHPS